MKNALLYRSADFALTAEVRAIRDVQSGSHLCRETGQRREHSAPSRSDSTHDCFYQFWRVDTKGRNGPRVPSSQELTERDPGSQLRTRRPTQWTCKLNREIFGKVLALRRKLLGSRKPNENLEIMWAIFTDLRNLKTSHRVDRIFRVVGYGTILVLLCFADVVVEAARKSPGG